MVLLSAVIYCLTKNSKDCMMKRQSKQNIKIKLSPRSFVNTRAISKLVDTCQGNCAKAFLRGQELRTSLSKKDFRRISGHEQPNVQEKGIECLRSSQVLGPASASTDHSVPSTFNVRGKAQDADPRRWLPTSTL